MAKGDLKELEQAVRNMQAVLDKVKQQPALPPAGGPNVRIIINGQEIKPGDPRFPRIRIVSPGGQPIPPDAPVPVPPEENPKPGDKKPEKTD
ncbi:MAG: hypothetical protein RMI91_13015 [Gemmatales bacterium]|nr:hypothetical protein [Gemmatales bacterium]MDW7995564.1 hypothetical protein [Gemmatales bacterium]